MLFNKTRNDQWELDETVMTVTARFGTGGCNTPLILEVKDGTISNGNGTGECRDNEGGCPTLNTTSEQPILIGEKGHAGVTEDGTTPTLQQKEKPIVGTSIVRRLTPLECTRLQGYPDGWVDIGDWVDSKGKRHKDADSPKYKALGNSIALPYWKVLLKRISAQYDRDATLGSLFDGIGGFPYLWEQINGKGSAVWASEIEEFPIAVTKKHFPEVDDDHRDPH